LEARFVTPGAALARLFAARLTRTPRAWFPIAAWFALAVGAAIVARTSGNAHAAGHVLLGAYGALALPLLVYAVVAAALGGEGLARAVAPLVAFGARPAHATLAAIAVSAAFSAVLGALLAAVVACIAHGPADPPLAIDLATSAWIGALGGVAYAALFSFGASLGGRAFGRSAVLVVDFLFGHESGAMALFTPRAHLRNLLGGSPPLEISQRASLVALVVLALLYAMSAASFSRRSFVRSSGRPSSTKVPSG
jgi:hypothetical protein